MGLTEDKLENIPHRPGVYLIKDAQEKVIYVGKAKDLKKRLMSYLQKGRSHGPKVEAVVSRGAFLETIVTENEKEALILECSLIKSYRPKYNVILRDDKNYLSLRINPNDKFPRITLVRRVTSDGALYFGPFSSASAVRDTLRLLQKVFPLRRCPDSVFKSRLRPCLNFQMKRCLGPCAGTVSEEEYREYVDQVIMFFQGRMNDLVSLLEKEMNSLAEREEYEKAALYRDRLTAVRRTLERQSVVSSRPIDLDAIGLYRRGEQAEVSIFFVRHGAVIGHKSFFLRAVDTEEELLSNFLKQFYSEEKYIPEEILIPFPFEDQAVFSERLKDHARRKTSLVVPRRGDKRHLLALASENAEHAMGQQLRKDEDISELLQLLQDNLKLRHYPERIEGLDISNLSGKMAVGSVVAFIRGRPETSLYRRYKIRLPEEPNDYAMMQEVVTRRLRRAQQEESWPNLLLIDGGRGQLGVAQTVLKDIRLEGMLDVIALAKGNQGEQDKVYLPYRKNPVVLRENSPVLLYLQRIRDESHRFAIQYHRRIRENRTRKSILTDIPGVGPLLAKRLLIAFGSVEGLRKAAVQEILSVKGLNLNLAEAVKNFLTAQDADAPRFSG
ncbi:MAG: excinuclease ABC subunit UvrC [Pseudomonadota bacterium]